MLYIAAIIIGILFVIMFFINRSSLFYEESSKKEEPKLPLPKAHKEETYDDLLERNE